ncbi:MAG: rhamnogalacturonan lyase family protein [Elusimicrobiota bacterium]
MKRAFFFSFLLLGGALAAEEKPWPAYPGNPFVIPLKGLRSGLAPGSEGRETGRGGVTVYDVSGDGLLDYLITRPGQIGAYDHGGRLLWIAEEDIRLSAQSETEGLPGLHAPGLAAGDSDGDGRAEVLFLDGAGRLISLDGATGRVLARRELPRPPGFPPPEHLVLCNLRGRGDRDLIAQSTDPSGYRMGRFVAAYSLDGPAPALLWSTSEYLGCAHNGLRASDLDGDGVDEIIGATFFRADGTLVPWTRPGRLYAWLRRRRPEKHIPWFKFPHYQGHLDSVYVEDVRPDLPNLELVALQEGEGMRTFLYNLDGLLWDRHVEYQEPQNAAVGDFDPDRPGLEIWCRSRRDEDQSPWVFSSTGAVIARWNMRDAAPADWTPKGVDAIFAVHWDGSGRQHLALKERHKDGDAAVVDALTGRFLRRFPSRAQRIYVADVAGDWREEVILVTETALHVYANPDPNPRPDEPRLWTLQRYRRAKMTHNYYSP